MRYLVFAAALLGGHAGANGLDDMKAALAPLQGMVPLRGAYEVHETRIKPGKAPETLMAAAMVSEDASAFEVRWERGLLKRAFDESSPAKGANKKDGLSALIASSSPARIGLALNYAPRLLQSLVMGTFKSERADAWQGKPARLVEVLILPEEAPNDSVAIKENSIAAQFWIGADGVPLGAVTTHTIKARLMVFMTYEKTTREELTFVQAGNRLVVLKRDSQGKEKGPGSEHEFRNLYTFTPKG